MNDRFSVTEVRNALRCPRIFALGRLEGGSVSFPVGSSCLGATFHRIVELFSRSVGSPPKSLAVLAAGAPRDAVQEALTGWLLDRLVTELEADPTYHSIPGEVDDLAEALRELASHLTGRLARFPEAPAAALTKLVHAGERQVEASWPGGIVVHGRLDALYRDQAGSLEVIEYKLTDEANDDLDRAQVVLYRELLQRGEQVAARPTVLRFTPTIRESAMTPAASDALVRETLAPLLEEMRKWSASPGSAPATRRRDLCSTCPMSTPCAQHYPERVGVRDDPPTAGVRPHANREGALTASVAPPPAAAEASDLEGRREAEALRDRILAELKDQGTSAVCPHPPIVGPTLYVIEIARPRGPVGHLDRAAEDVKHRLASSLGVDLDYVKDGGHRRFVLRRSVPRRVLLGPLLESKSAWLMEKPGRFVVGEQPNGTILTGDLADSSSAHLLIAGQTGSGKSVLIQSLIASLVRFHGPAGIRFTLVDPKRVTFIGARFISAISAHLDGPIRYDLEETLPAIRQLVELMEERYRLFETAKVSDLDEYNEAEPGHILERRVLVIDEFQDLVAEKDSAREFFDGVKRLGAKARAAGIHMVLATQRPDRETIPSIIKANLGGKIALQVATQTNSRIVLDQGGAEKLLGRGDLLANLGRGLVRAQAPLISV